MSCGRSDTLASYDFALATAIHGLVDGLSPRVVELSQMSNYPLALTLAALALTGSARADERTACVDASEHAQQLRDEQKLIQARAELLVCARDICPGPVKKDCAEMLADLTRRTPSIVVRTQGRGAGVTDIVVSVDGRIAATRLDGAPIPVDPGPHTLQVALAAPAVDQNVVVAPGDHERLITVELPQAQQEGSASSEGHGQRAAGVVVGVAGLGAIVAGVAFGVVAIGDKNTQLADCSSLAQCPSFQAAAAAHNDAILTNTLSTVSFIAGGALLVTGVIVFFTAPSRRAVHLALSGAGMALHGTF